MWREDKPENGTYIFRVLLHFRHHSPQEDFKKKGSEILDLRKEQEKGKRTNEKMKDEREGVVGFIQDTQGKGRLFPFIGEMCLMGPMGKSPMRSIPNEVSN